MLGPATSRARMSSRLHPTHEHTEEGGLLIARRLGRLGHAFDRTWSCVCARAGGGAGGAPLRGLRTPTQLRAPCW